jgi:hypothetical protein
MREITQVILFDVMTAAFEFSFIVQSFSVVSVSFVLIYSSEVLQNCFYEEILRWAKPDFSVFVVANTFISLFVVVHGAY